MKAFSEHNQNMQLAWDASSIKNYQFCPRYYQLVNLEGWRDGGVHLEFGGLVASGFERFQKARLDGLSIVDALVGVVRWALEETYYEGEYWGGNEDDGTPSKAPDTQWGGRYETMWKCEGTTSYKNAKGNRAVCPFAHKRSWFPGDAPDICVECKSGIRSERRYLPNDPSKNRYTLLRTLIWYGLSQPEELEEGYHPYTFPDGTKAVELSGRLPLPWSSSFGEQYLLTWNFDYIGQFGDELFITDNKTTGKTLNDGYFNSFSPDTQFDTYSMVATLAYPGLDIKGVMVDAVQVLVGGSEFGKHPYYKDETQHEEHFNDLEHWIRDAERSARQGYWRMNKRNCWLCPMKGVCSKPPRMREAMLEANFTKRPRWDTLAQR